MRRVLPWVGAFLIAVLAGGGAVVGLNATIFGPGDFVRVYLDALARGDAEGALALPGVDADGAGDQLLTDDVLTGLSDIRQVSDVALGGTRHEVTFAWTSPGGEGTTAFEVERVGTRLGLFPEWGFAESPVAVLALDVQHDPRFSANGVDTSTGRDDAGSTDIAVLVPGSYVLGHDTAFLQADEVTVVADEVGATIDATVDVEPAPEFAPTLARVVRSHLEDCGEQHVLFPTGCPYGQSIANRITSDPEWTIVEVPDFGLKPGPFGTWIAGPAPGTAHLTVEVKSLFDGSVSTFDQDVPFQARYSVTVVDDNMAILEQSEDAQ
ncbi:MAG: hypothetical protein ABI566_02750 [Pseudolysinimonas sp.]